MEWKKEWTIPSVTGVISFSAGVVVGVAATSYYHYKKTQEAISEIENRTDAFIDQLKTDFDAQVEELISKFDPRSIEQDTAMKVFEGITGRGANSDQLIEVQMPTPTSVFSDSESDDDWDYNEEIANRSQDVPYVIHHNEFDDDDQGYSRSTLTYYEGDDILTDEHDVPVHNHLRIVGLLRFGHGSDDPNVVYIRNDRLAAEYEILRDSGYYQVEILGEEIEDTLNQERTIIHKFRQQD